MKRLLLLMVFVFALAASAQAQSLKPKAFGLEQNNAMASRNIRKDEKGENCALILVDVVGVGNIKFKEAVGETDYTLNEYKVYVPKNTKTLTYSYDGKSGVIKLDGQGQTLESLQTYRLVLETESRMRSAIFYVNPQDAQLVFDGKVVALDQNGAVAIDKPIGTYSYTVRSKGYLDYSGKVELTEDVINKTVDVQLEEKMYNVALNCPVKEATLFIDNEPYGKIGELGESVQLAEGKHTYRITHEGYEDAMGEISVLNDKVSLNVQMKMMKEKRKVFRNERTKTTISMRNHMDVLISGLTYLEDDFKSYLGTFSFSWSQHTLGVLTFREGIEIGAGIASGDYSRKVFDKYHDNQIEKKNAVPLNVNIPVQMGLSLPLNAYNTCFVSFLGGAYGAYYYTGHKPSSMNESYDKEVSTEIWDWGVRLNVMLYFKKFVLGFEGSRSLNNPEIGTVVGIKMGYKIAL